MPNLKLIHNSDDLTGMEMSPLLPSATAVDLVKNLPDAHWILADGSLITGHLSLWWCNMLNVENHRVGFIGHYAACDKAASHQLLKHACEELAAHGCTLAVGPVDGSTMHRYRFITDRGTEPLFIMEPDNLDEWPLYWQEQGFTSLASYYSALETDLSQEDPRIPAAEERLANSGIKIRTMDPDAFEEELRRIYAVSAISFQRNFLYTPFSEEEYLAQYMPLRHYVNPQMVLLAELENQPVGFMFNMPDLLQAQRGEKIDTVIMKTFAVLPGRMYAGLGNVLLAYSRRMARELGYSRAIHALMYEKNNSLTISGRFAQPIRRYSVFAKVLQP